MTIGGFLSVPQLIMEDSGYYSHKSGEFKLFSSASSDSSYRRRLFSRELLSLSYQQFKESEKFGHLVSGFRDESDFEEFKADLRDFWRLKESTHEVTADPNSPNPERMLMEFFNSDENFKEFERVFDDFKYHRFYDFDDLKKRHSRGDPRLAENGRGGKPTTQMEDDFSEFFDNDEDFRKFEQEFANFKVMQRRSRALDDFNRRSWCDLRSDINAASENRKGQSANGNRQSFHKDGDEGVSEKCKEKTESNTPHTNPDSGKGSFNRQSSGESQYYTCREFPPGSPVTNDGKFAYGTPPDHDPPSYEFVMQNRKPRGGNKSQSCDYSDIPEKDVPNDTKWTPRTHLRSQSYDFARNSDHIFQDTKRHSGSRQPKSDHSRYSDARNSGAYQNYFDSRTTNGSFEADDVFDEEMCNSRKSNTCSRSQSYDFSENVSNSNKKFNAKSHSFDSTDIRRNKSANEFSRSESHNFCEEKVKGHGRSSTSSCDTKYEYSGADKKSNESSHSQSNDFSKHSSNQSSNTKSNSQSRNHIYENSNNDFKESNVKTRSSSKTESCDFSETSQSDKKSEKVNSKTQSANSTEECRSKSNINGQKSKSSSKSRCYDFSQSSQKVKDKESESSFNRHSFDEKVYKDKASVKGGRKPETLVGGLNVPRPSPYTPSDEKTESRPKFHLDSSHFSSVDESDVDSFPCSDDDLADNEHIFREIYHGCSDFTGYDPRKYPGARRLVSNLPTVYSRHSSDSEIDMGGTYPNIRLDRVPINEGLKRRSAEYYQEDEDDYLPYVRLAKDYGRRSNSDQSVYFPRSYLEKQNNPRHKNDCQYTCHHRCRPLVTLDCTTVSSGNSEEDKQDGVETSLTGMYQCQSCQSETTSSPLNMSPDFSQSDSDSGYRSGGVQGRHRSNSRSRIKYDPDSAKREELRTLIDIHNEHSPSSLFCFIGDSLSFQGFIRVTLNLIRPITMSLGARPPSIYEVLTREHIVEQNTMSISFYMPRDTIKQIHVTSEDTTKEVITALLKKFKILDNPRKFALYAQELNNGKIVKLWRVGDKDTPLSVCLKWGCEDLKKHRLVLQENETGEIEWNAFSEPELQNFMRILDKEEGECVAQLQYKYKVMKRIIQQRMKEIRKERKKESQRS